MNSYETYTQANSSHRPAAGVADGTRCRWGMYLGKSTVNQDAMIFVSGAAIDTKDGK
jgi:hypothetical protein